MMTNELTLNPARGRGAHVCTQMLKMFDFKTFKSKSEFLFVLYPSLERSCCGEFVFSCILLRSMGGISLRNAVRIKMEIKLI